VAETFAKRVIIIGAGPQGLATGIELLENGCDVTILESQDQLGRGVSYRPDFNQYGILHSGAYYPYDSKRGKLSRRMYEMIESSEACGILMEIYRKCIRKTGKLIIARTDDGVENIEIFQDRLKNGKVSYSLLTKPSEIAALDEPTLGDPTKIKAILNLSNVGIIHIKEYIKDLAEAFEKSGGTIKLSHDVTGFAIPSATRNDLRTGVICKIGLAETTLFADAVINMAGLYVLSVAERAAQALQKSNSKIGPPPTPDVRYDRFFVLVERNRDRQKTSKPLTRRVVYVADSAVLDGQYSTVGIHSYCCDELKPGQYTMSFGNYIQRGIPSTEIWDMDPALPQLDEEMWQKAETVYPRLNRLDYELKFVGRIGIALTQDNQRDMVYTSCTDSEIGFSVINCYTADSPGLTCSPVIAKEVAGMVIDKTVIVRARRS
jgi:glycine/D-amino acid oxidase-like deaminating enzyme